MKARTWVDHLAFEGGGSVFEKILQACILDWKNSAVHARWVSRKKHVIWKKEISFLQTNIMHTHIFEETKTRVHWLNKSHSPLPSLPPPPSKDEWSTPKQTWQQCIIVDLLLLGKDDFELTTFYLLFSLSGRQWLCDVAEMEMSKRGFEENNRPTCSLVR